MKIDGEDTMRNIAIYYEFGVCTMLVENFCKNYLL